MKLLEKFTSDEIPRYYYYFFGFITAFFILFYIYYSFNAWFMQDDINFLYKFGDNIRWGSLFSFNTLYRFLSIEIYWHYLYKFFGTTAALYFTTNLLILGLNTILLFLFLKGLCKDTTIALVSALVYFIMPPTIKNMTWICNNQHLMSHFFAFLFCHLYFNKGGIDDLHYPGGMLLTLLLFFTLISNFLAACFIPCIIFYHLLYLKEIKLRKPNILFLVLWGLMFIFFVLASSMFTGMLQAPEYGTSISPAVFIKTLQSYSYHIYKNVPILVITIALIYAIGIIKKDKLVLFFMSSAICFYMPYAFAVFQRNANYLAISYALYSVAIVIILKKHIRVPALILLFLLYNFFNTNRMVREFSENPAGDRVRVFIGQMKEEYFHKELFKFGKVFFKTDEPVLYKTGIEAIDKKDTPIFWLRLVDGLALKLFLDPALEYRAVKYDEKAPADYPVIIVSKDLYGRGDIGVKRVIMPDKKGSY
jgi:hypothetical protein